MAWPYNPSSNTSSVSLSSSQSMREILPTSKITRNYANRPRQLLYIRFSHVRRWTLWGILQDSVSKSEISKVNGKENGMHSGDFRVNILPL
jgi:hypothetical protein